MGCKEGCSEEFKRSNFLLSGEDPKRFIMPEWNGMCGGCHLWYLLWRVMWAVLFIALLIMDWTVDYGRYQSEEDKIKWFIYLLSWSLIVSNLDVILQAITSIHGYRKHKQAGSFDYAIPEMTWYLKLQWVLSNVGMTSAIMTTVFYWVILYLPVRFDLHWMNIALHGPNVAYYILNLFITAQPLRVYHAWHSLLFGLVFSLFTLIYEMVGGTNASGIPGVYELVQWREAPGLAVGYILCLLCAAIVIWLVLYILYRIRHAIACEFNKSCPGAMTHTTVQTHAVQPFPKSSSKKVKSNKVVKSKKVDDQHVSIVDVYQ